LTEAAVRERFVVDVSGLAPGGLLSLDLGGREVLVCNVDGTFHVIENRCPHAAVPLSDGRLRGCVLECPWHGGTLDVRDGSPQSPPIRRPVARFPVRSVEGGLEIELGA
jgi:nitrite reductase/ring-hydroxylating ferredoxin subunit